MHLIYEGLVTQLIINEFLQSKIFQDDVKGFVDALGLRNFRLSDGQRVVQYAMQFVADYPGIL